MKTFRTVEMTTVSLASILYVHVLFYSEVGYSTFGTLNLTEFLTTASYNSKICSI